MTQAIQHTSNDFFLPLRRVIELYLSPKQVNQVYSAFLFAEQAHDQQFRASGEKYITHPVAVAEICATWRLDTSAIMAALLHDVIEDQDVSKDEVSKLFNPDVAAIVDGVSKIERLEFETKAQQQAESFRKMLLAMANDVRVILIKLADRLHNMRTLGVMAPDKKRRIAQETIDIYTPIANKLGLNIVYRELQDLCFQALHPVRYIILSKALQRAERTPRELITQTQQAIEQAFINANIAAEIITKDKNLFSIYQKMTSSKQSFTDVYDTVGFRVIVADKQLCYTSLSVLHGLYKPVPNKFSDYIANPKINGYQSIHTTVSGPLGMPIEFQIRTPNMHQIAEIGVTSHWLTKDEILLKDAQKRTFKWLESLLTIQAKTGDSSEFIENIKVDLTPDEVYVFTPRGKIIALPKGGTPIDFAYLIHTDVGNHAAAAKINGEFASLRTQLNSGDTLEIITDEAPQANIKWLDFVQTGKARSEILHFLRHKQLDSSIEVGERLLKQAMATLSLAYPSPEDLVWDKVNKRLGVNSMNELLADIGLGKRMATVVARSFISDDPISTTAHLNDMVEASYQTKIQGNEGKAIVLASCCHPIPGDSLIANVRLGKGLIVHVHDCPKAIEQKENTPEHWVDVSWDKHTVERFNVRISVLVVNKIGMLGELATMLANAHANIVHVGMPDEDTSSMIALQFIIQVADRKHLADVFKSVRLIPLVRKIVRVKN